jgi:hypothetical protein
MQRRTPRLTDAEGALIDELTTLVCSDEPAISVKDVELRLEGRGYTDAHSRKAVMSLLRRGWIELRGRQRLTFTKAGHEAVKR